MKRWMQDSKEEAEAGKWGALIDWILLLLTLALVAGLAVLALGGGAT